jgi:hypothetical protein
VSVREQDNPALYAKIQEQNLLRQYDLLSNCIEIGLEKGIEAFDKYTLLSLNYYGNVPSGSCEEIDCGTRCAIAESTNVGRLQV